MSFFIHSLILLSCLQLSLKMKDYSNHWSLIEQFEGSSWSIVFWASALTFRPWALQILGRGHAWCYLTLELVRALNVPVFEDLGWCSLCSLRISWNSSILSLFNCIGRLNERLPRVKLYLGGMNCSRRKWGFSGGFCIKNQRDERAFVPYKYL